MKLTARWAGGCVAALVLGNALVARLVRHLRERGCVWDAPVLAFASVLCIALGAVGSAASNHSQSVARRRPRPTCPMWICC